MRVLQERLFHLTTILVRLLFALARQLVTPKSVDSVEDKLEQKLLGFGRLFRLNNIETEDQSRSRFGHLGQVLAKNVILH